MHTAKISDDLAVKSQRSLENLGASRGSHRVGTSMRLLAVVAAFSLAIVVVRTSRADPSTTSPQQGYDLGEIWMPRGVALADAQVALGTSTAALYNNPGSMPFARTYHFEALASVSPEARRQSYGGAV